MFHSKLKETLNTSIAEVVSGIDSFVYNPGRDYSRVKKLSADQVLSFLISQGASSTKCEFSFRQFPRLKTAHFRKPKYLIYRVS